MNRRDAMKLMAIGASAASWPVLALDRTSAFAVIYDGRFAQGRAFALGSSRTFDCQFDAALLWHHHFAAINIPMPVIDGLTTPADALVLADCARRSGWHLSQSTSPASGSQLIAWRISSTKLQ